MNFLETYANIQSNKSKYTRVSFMGNEINIALLQMLPGKDITENMEKGIII